MTEDQFYALLDAVKALNVEQSGWETIDPRALFDTLTTPGDGADNPSIVGERAVYRIHCWATDNR